MHKLNSIDKRQAPSRVVVCRSFLGTVRVRSPLLPRESKPGTRKEERDMAPFLAGITYVTQAMSRGAHTSRHGFALLPIGRLYSRSSDFWRP